jgi:hypothetical protein
LRFLLVPWLCAARSDTLDARHDSSVARNHQSSCPTMHDGALPYRCAAPYCRDTLQQLQTPATCYCQCQCCCCCQQQPVGHCCWQSRQHFDKQTDLRQSQTRARKSTHHALCMHARGFVVKSTWSHRWLGQPGVPQCSSFHPGHGVWYGQEWSTTTVICCNL